MISVITPCYNEQEALPVFYAELKKVLSEMNEDHEILFIDDGSSDGTLSEMKKLSAQDSHVRFFSFSRNFGKEAAMFAGFNNARGDYVAVMDADLQDPPSLLPKMMEILKSGEYDSVAARRKSRTGEAPVRSFLSKGFYKVMNRMASTDIKEGARDFRLMKRDMVNAITAMSEYNRFTKGIFNWVGFRTCWLDYENEKRVAGQTKWNMWGLGRYALDGIVSFSSKPLSIASWLGIFMTVIAFIMLLFVVIRRLIFGDPVAGWASTICVIIFIGGLQLFCLGIMGQYLAKIYLETKNRPHYIIAESSDEGIEKIR